MARVTVEDCLKNKPNPFELVLIAAVRARALERGAKPAIAVDKDKPTVIALREIAMGAYNPHADLPQEEPHENNA